MLPQELNYYNQTTAEELVSSLYKEQLGNRQGLCRLCLIILPGTELVPCETVIEYGFIKTNFCFMAVAIIFQA